MGWCRAPDPPQAAAGHLPGGNVIPIASTLADGHYLDVDSEAPAPHGKPLPLILARELASNLATPMFVIDARGMLVYYNDAAAQLIGKPFGEKGEISAAEFGALLNLKTTDGEPLRRRDSPSGIAFMQRRPAHLRLYASGYDGTEWLLHATAYPLFGTNGEMSGVVSVFWPVGDEEAAI